MSRTFQRVMGVALLLGAGALSLPVTAALLDGSAAENWIIPVQAGVMAVIGAVCGLALPALAPTDVSTAVRALIGAGWGLIAGTVGVFVFWFLLGGFGGT
ncbi:hypothetical protein [Nesterenkonia sandarakina]|uniref:Uncharacterized protein n=1 Tax=Nesterenkonia sandarakina TaxID=272918 RepID=A0A2T0YLG0_9MICC|nr:hypothetical protein [Nesterenkonia sandarakina]PRZ16106.1 hypothetical protein BCL67_10730 [Nesterenkonia sandarakina]